MEGTCTFLVNKSGWLAQTVFSAQIWLGYGRKHVWTEPGTYSTSCGGKEITFRHDYLCSYYLGTIIAEREDSSIGHWGRGWGVECYRLGFSRELPRKLNGIRESEGTLRTWPRKPLSPPLCFDPCLLQGRPKTPTHSGDVRQAWLRSGSAGSQTADSPCCGAKRSL